jgi:DNA polymerase V
MEPQRTYLALDLKSFYASVECVERGLDPLTTNLVVADAARTEKTICLAVSPSLKALGIPGRPRLFEVVQQVQLLNARRLQDAPGHAFSGSSVFAPELQADPALRLDYVTAPPRMARYLQYSTQIYQIYLRYIAPEDMHVYSIDEVFLDVTPYLRTYRCSARELAQTMLRDVLEQTGITATAGIGSNLYLCKIAMDIVAKRIPPDRNGVRIAQLDESNYRRQLWDHRPLTDFWRVGGGYARKLEAHGLFTMGDIARCSVQNEALLYKLFGKNAELLIDHAWGWEPCTMAQIKAYRPGTNSLSSGQVLQRPYGFSEARLVVREMADLLTLELVDKGLVTDQLTLTIGYDQESLRDPAILRQYHGAVTTDGYGRRIPRHAHGTVHLDRPGSSTKAILAAVLDLYDRIVHPALLVRRITIVANRVCAAQEEAPAEPIQLDLFSDPAAQLAAAAARDREQRMQRALLDIKKKYGKNAILKGMNLRDGATAQDRNRQIGGHHE